ncbi:MAG: tRNA lysidine(34) synthetase TilS [Gammaproteobacteria bacterium]|nr:tRNA lysidine(34) synthetase TilS [Gammaproteobacteria bacterium]MBU1656086.1 tRNA lysidine(34) synthetase TilS [Gammaproteobacteria bacterium]MBU1962171.1 tRNA lysidine(34) synthetase TilS [Gammaproteobacteria bacterium]
MASSLPDSLIQSLAALPRASRYLIAFSGGVDSMVLLHALAGIREGLGAELLAIHVDHGLQPPSRDWAEWCRLQCESLRVPFLPRRLNLRVTKGESPEATARHARYQALTGEMRPGDLLLTAHHQDDQAETLLLHLLRGAGSAGLAAMPLCRPFGPGHLARPLLQIPRSRLIQYAEQQELVWLDDPSNRDTAFDRNYLRHEIIPLMLARWPAYAETLSRSAALCAEAEGLLEGMARELLEGMAKQPGVLDLNAFARLDPSKRRLVMRAWIKRQGAPIPDHRLLERLCSEPVNAGRDRHPRLEWGNAGAQRFRDELHLLRRNALFASPGGTIIWSGGERLELPGNGALERRLAEGGIDPARWERARVEIRYRRGGEQCRPAGRGLTKPLKKLLQEAGLPPWLRERQPLIYLDGELAAVPGLCACEPFAVDPGQKGWWMDWKNTDLVYSHYNTEA